MSTRETGGPAFPGLKHYTDKFPADGMTLRDYFAAKAMQGLQSNSLAVDWPDRVIAISAYRLADAMLVERTNHESKPSS